MSHAHAPQSPSLSTPDWSDPRRQADFNTWLSHVAPLQGLDITSVHIASADASFRRYFRVNSTAGSRIIMDAPPEKEDCRPFAKVAQLMAQAGVHAPQVLAWDEARGFMLLTDLGAHTMMQVIQPDNPLANRGLYLQAIDALIAWQLASRPDVLPPYDEALLHRELQLFPDWYLTRHRGTTLDADQQRTLNEAFKCIIEHNLAWPSVYVHRDFMPRNLMVCETGGQPCLGVLDFQDAVYGPITYDIASLMRDAFLSWEEDFCLDITIRYWEKARKARLPVGDDFG